jgi:hypothetical protein
MRIAVVPDTQCKPDIDMSYLTAIGNYLVKKKPDVIIHIGDHWDMPSLSSYDFGKKSFEGRRYANDIRAGNEGFHLLNAPVEAERQRLRKNKEKQWNPSKYFLFGNHEQRIERAVNNDAKLDGVLGYGDLDTLDYERIPFLEPLLVEGIAFSHYFTTGLAGRPATTAAAQLNKQHMSCIAGHQQGLQIATGKRADGHLLTSVIAGSCYPHDEHYLGQQGNNHWRGMLLLNNVDNGSFDLATIPLSYLMEKYS